MSDANVLLSRAKSAMLAHDYQQAAKIYKSLILEEPNNLDYKMQLGNLYTKAGKDDQALTIFQQIRKVDNENIDILLAISGIYRRQEKYEESIALLEQALLTCQDNPKNHAKISYNLGFTYRQMGNLDDAIKCFEEVVEENPSDVLANNHLGAVYAQQGNHRKAIEAYNRGLKYDPNHPILQYNIAESYAEIGDNTKALTFFEGALRAKPGWTEAIESYANLLLGENKVSEADAVVTQALEINPDDVKMHTAKGNVYNRQNIFEDAETEYKKALSVDDSYKNALTGLANSLENQGKMDEAVETISKAENLHPDDLKIIKQSAHIHISAKKLDAAYDKISKLQTISKNDVQTINLLGQYYISNDQADKAEECFTDIKKIDPEYNDVYRDWAERFMQMGDDSKAEPYLQAAIQKNPDDARAMVNLGQIYEKQKKPEQALKLYKKANSVDVFNQRSKAEAERIVQENSDLLAFANEVNENSNIDFDAIFSGGKLNSDGSEEEKKLEEENFKNEDVLVGKETNPVMDNLLNDNEEISLSLNDSDFNEDISEVPDVNLADDKKDSSDESFDFNQFGMQNLEEDENKDMADIADILESDESMLTPVDDSDFDTLLDDGAPIDEEDDALETDFTPIPDGSEEIESPSAPKKAEISDESLNNLEEQIKKAAELAEKANYAAESAWKAANMAADMAQGVEENQKIDETEEEEEPQERSDEVTEDLEDEAADEMTFQDEKIEAESEDDIQSLPQKEEADEDESLLNEEDLSNDAESEDFFEDIPDALTDEGQQAEEAPKDKTIDDLTLRRAIDMLPSIIAAIEDRSMLYRFRSFLEMFKKLREMLDYLPPSQRGEFMTSRNRLLLDYVISKLAGKPGLFATAKALVRSGLIHENPDVKKSEKEGIELTKEVIENLKKLSENLEDKNLQIVLNNEADKFLKKLESEDLND